MRKKLKRGALTKLDAKFIGGWVPNQMLLQIDEAIRSQDLDRSKFIRAALKEKLERTALATA